MSFSCFTEIITIREFGWNITQPIQAKLQYFAVFGYRWYVLAGLELGTKYFYA